MSTFRSRDFYRLGLLVLIGILVLVDCDTIPSKRTDLPGPAGTLVQGRSPTVIVSSPELALEDALNTIRTKYGVSVPSQDTLWQKDVIQSEILAETQSYQYTSNHWNAQVTYPIQVAPESIIYTIEIRNLQNGFEWVGLVDAFGKVESVTAEVPIASTSSVTSVWSTETAVPTSTPLPTQTPRPTLAPTSTSTPTPIPCNAAEFITDVTIPDGSAFTPNTAFEKIWRLKNVGTCTWTEGYDLVFINGNEMDGPSAIALPGIVESGQSIDISVRLKAPAIAGDYQSFWMLRDSDNVLFGIGDDADKPFWVSIAVAREKGNYYYDFAINYCSANWRTENRQISCNRMAQSDDNGFVEFLSAPALENRHENEPALWVHSNEKRYGWIEGSYPALTIQSGDVFRAWVGCLEGYQRCNVNFYLAYETNDGRIHTLKSWEESYDGNITKIELNLSSLEGRTVHFILGMKANTHNVQDAQGFWFVPRIERWTLDRKGTE